MRARLPETPIFEQIKARGQIVRAPFFEMVLKNPRDFLIATGLKLSEVSWVYMLTIFVVVYATTKLGLPKSLMLNAILIAAILELFTILQFGHLSDVYGRRIFYFAGVAFTSIFAFPLFWLLGTKSRSNRDPHRRGRAEFRTRSDVCAGIDYFPNCADRRCAIAAPRSVFISAAIGGGFAPIIATALAAYMAERRAFPKSDPARADHFDCGAVCA